MRNANFGRCPPGSVSAWHVTSVRRAPSRVLRVQAPRLIGVSTPQSEHSTRSRGAARSQRERHAAVRLRAGPLESQREIAVARRPGQVHALEHPIDGDPVLGNQPSLLGVRRPLREAGIVLQSAQHPLRRDADHGRGIRLAQRLVLGGRPLVEHDPVLFLDQLPTRALGLGQPDPCDSPFAGQPSDQRPGPPPRGPAAPTGAYCSASAEASHRPISPHACPDRRTERPNPSTPVESEGSRWFNG